MARYSQDPRWTNSKRAGTDANGQPYAKGDRIFLYPASGVVLTGEAAQQAARDFHAAVADEEFGGC